MSGAVVVGASRGIGLGFVRHLRALGREVLGTVRDQSGRCRVEETGARAFELDVTEPGAFADLARELAGSPPDLVVLNAGAFGERSGATAAPEREDFDRIMRTNVYAALQAIPALAPLLGRTGGRFVAITSDMGSIAGLESSMGILYRASKAALNMVIRAAALDFPEVLFLAQSPGWVRTDMGGAEAPLSVAESVTAMLRSIESADRAASGSYRALAGDPLPW